MTTTINIMPKRHRLCVCVFGCVSAWEASISVPNNNNIVTNTIYLRTRARGTKTKNQIRIIGSKKLN
jgi:hypothetical protein